MLLKRHRFFICIYPAPSFSHVQKESPQNRTSYHYEIKNRNDTILFDMGHGFDIFGSEMNL